LRRSASQEIPHILCGKSSLPCSQQPATSFYPQPDQSTTRPHPIYISFILILFSQ